MISLLTLNLWIMVWSVATWLFQFMQILNTIAESSTHNAKTMPAGLFNDWSRAWVLASSSFGATVACCSWRRNEPSSKLHTKQIVFYKIDWGIIVWKRSSRWVIDTFWCGPNNPTLTCSACDRSPAGTRINERAHMFQRIDASRGWHGWKVYFHF